MTTFDDLFKRVAVPLLQAQFGEWFIYTPRDGAPRRVQAIFIDRQPPAPLGSAPDQHVPELVIQVKNDPDDGIASQSIDTGGDSVVVSKRCGATPVVCQIVKLISDKGGVTAFEVR